MIRPVILTGPPQRSYAKELIDKAPDGYIAYLKEPTRNVDQNAKMWAMIEDVKKAEPNGRKMTSEDWKCAFMSAAGWECEYIEGLDGRPFPIGFRSSRLTIRQMAHLITYIAAYGDEHGVQWRDPNPYEDAA